MGDATSRALRVALIADREAQGKHLRELLETNGLDVIVDQAIGEYSPERVGTDDVDVLLVNLDEETSNEMERLEALIENSSVPILFNEGGVRGSTGWGRKLIAKLNGLAQGRAAANRAASSTVAADAAAPTAADAGTGEPAPRPALRVVPPNADHSAPARTVWVLGASLGGPQALKVFLSHLPGDLPVGFVLAQHIGKPFVPLLAEQLDRVAEVRVVPAEHNRTVRTKEVILVPVDKRFRLSESGVVEFTDEPIRGPYKPCIDEVMEEVVNCYGKNCGAIVFSGMGEDGSIGAVAVSEAGGPVWAQESDSCVISSMPDAARRTGVVSYTGTPEHLARQLAEHIGVEAAAL